MAWSSDDNGLAGGPPRQRSTLSGWATTHQHAPASAIAGIAAATVPRHGLRGGSLLFQALRRGPWRLSARLQCTAPRVAAAAGTAAPTCAVGGAATRGPLSLGAQLRGQLQLRQGAGVGAGVGRPYSSTTAAEAAARCGLLAGRGGGAAAGLRRSAPLRLLTTQATAGAASASASASAVAAAAAPRGGGGGGSLFRLRGRLGEALRLQLAAAWQKYGTAAYVGMAVAAVFVVWRLMRSTTNLFIAVNDRMAEYGIMALAASLVLLSALFLRWRAAVSPGAVYRQALVQLNTHPGVLEVMGAPLVGSPVRAYVVTGGGLYLSKKFRIKLRSRRIQMMFPLSGPERKGLASLEAKRKHGRYVWKLLAVDLGPELQAALPPGGSTGLPAGPHPGPPQPAASPLPPSLPLDQQRVYVVGGLAAYQRGGVLGELRAPFLKALSNSRSYDVEDELEDELDELEVPGSKSAAAGTSMAAARSALQRAIASAGAAFKQPTAPPAPADTAAGGATSTTSPASGSGRAPGGGGSLGQAPAEWGAGNGSETTAPSTAGAPSRSWWTRLRGLISEPEAAPGTSAK